MAAVKSLCTRGIVLENGKVKLISDIGKAVSYYLSGSSDVINQRIFDSDYDRKEFKLEKISVKNIGEDFDVPLSESKEIELTTTLILKDNQAEKYHITYHLYNEMGDALFSFSNVDEKKKLKPGSNELKCTFPRAFFQSGQFFLSFFVIKDKREAIFVESDIISFTVVDSGRDFGVYMGREPGSIKPKFEWTLKNN